MAYIGQSIKNGTFSVLDTSGNTYNGSNTTFNLGTQVGSAAQLLVSHDGVIQKPGTDYTLATGGTQITFTTAPASGASIFIVEISGAVGGTITPSDNSVGIDQLNLSDGSSGQFLKTDGSGTISFATVSSVGGATGVDFNDNVKARFGTGNDLEIYHDGSNSYVVDNGTGDLYLQANDNVFIQQVGGSETFAKFTKNGSVELYYDNSKKVETTSSGATVTGRLTADATDEKPIVAHHTDGSAVTMGFQNNTSNSNTIGFDGTEFEVKGGGSTSFKVNSSGRFFASGGETISVGFWCKWLGTGTVALQDDFNVSSIGDVANGQYDVNFTVNCNNADYAVAGTSTASGHSGWNVKSAGIQSAPTNLAQGSVRIVTENNDSYYVSCIGFGDW